MIEVLFYPSKNKIRGLTLFLPPLSQDVSMSLSFANRYENAEHDPDCDFVNQVSF